MRRFPLPQDFSILLHAGYSTGDYWDNVVWRRHLIDWSVGVGYTIGQVQPRVEVCRHRNRLRRMTDDVFNNEGRVIFTIATTFPWSND